MTLSRRQWSTFYTGKVTFLDYPLVQCCPTFLTPRAAQDIIMKPRAAPVNSNATTKILLNINILYLYNCNLLKSEVFHNICTRYFWQMSPLLCHKLSQISDPVPLIFLYVTFSTYKLAIAKYNLNFKLMYNHLFIPLNIWFFQMKLTIILNFFLKACTTH